MRKFIFVFMVFLMLPIAAGADVPNEPAILVEDGMTQPVFSKEEAIVERVFIETEVDSDGDGENDRIRADLIRPKETEEGLKVPVIYEMSPYRAGLNPIDFHDVDVELNPIHPDSYDGKPFAGDLSGYYDDYFLPRGYAVILAESIGSGMSNGCPTTGDMQEILATKSVIDWLNGRATAYDENGEEIFADWSTGKVGMTGVSYNGTLPNGLATTGVEGLETIVPIGAISSWYDYYRSNGAVIAPGGYQGEDADSLARAVLTRDNPELCSDLMDQIEADQDRITGDYNDFWDERNYLNNVEDIHASVFVVHGLNDWNVKTEQFAQWWEELENNDVPRKLWLHQHGHSSPYSFRNAEWLTTLNKWFDYWLYDIDNGIMDEPMVDIQNADRNWSTENAWPHNEVQESTLYLTSESTNKGNLSHRPVIDKQVSQDIIDDSSIRAQELTQQPMINMENRQVYVTRELTDTYRISGTPKISINASIDEPVANLTALLVDYAPEGSSRIITRGWIDPQNLHSDSQSEALTAHQSYTFMWNMQPTDYEVKEGHRIGLVIISSDYDYTIRPKPGTVISIFPEQSYLSLPLVGDITQEPTSVKEIKKLIDYYEQQEAISSSITVRQLQTHLTAVERYEKEGSADKIRKHLAGFKLLLDYYSEHMTKEVFDILNHDVDVLLDKRY
ncbi:Xaa-Pro dipeptidyl-peptidase [Oceanobacillus sp. FSL H7-0719]|uniref:Xaa-Pro dipeptidyl-peptidase n=1 Tax=Oceanobacillus sp. FSL H7-0719 TaxID=2954507 RepID=UPI003248786C